MSGKDAIDKRNATPWYADFRLYILVFAVLTLFLVKSMFSQSSGGMGCAPVASGDFTVTTLDGGQFKLSETKGKVVFLNFWATWCRPCINELPSIENLRQRYADNPDFEIVTVACDEGETEEIKKFLTQFNRAKAVAPLSFGVYHDTSGQAAAAFGVSGFPTTFLIDRDGDVVKRFVGPRDYGDKRFFAIVEEMLAKTAD